MITKQKAEFDFGLLVKEVAMITRQILIMEQCQKRILARKQLLRTQELCRFKGKIWYYTN